MQHPTQVTSDPTYHPRKKYLNLQYRCMAVVKGLCAKYGKPMPIVKFVRRIKTPSVPLPGSAEDYVCLGMYDLAGTILLATDILFQLYPYEIERVTRHETLHYLVHEMHGEVYCYDTNAFFMAYCLRHDAIGEVSKHLMSENKELSECVTEIYATMWWDSDTQG